MRRSRSREAVSAAIAVVLALGIAITLLAILQTQAVPIWNSEVEFSHNERVQDQVVELRDAVLNAGLNDNPVSVNVELGTDYPNRLVLQNPPPSTGSLSTAFEAEATIANANASDPEVRDYWNGSQRNFSTAALAYSPSYNYYDDAPNTLYENTVAYNSFGDSNSTLSRQALVDGKRIHFVSLAGRLERVESRQFSANLQPLSASSRTVEVSNGSTNISLRLPTRLSQEKWSQLLSEEMTGNGGYVTDVTVADNNVTIELARQRNGDTVDYVLGMSRIGVGSGATQPGEWYVTDVGGTDFEIQAGNSRTLVAEVRDRHNNPVSGIDVDASADRGSLTALQDTSDTEGHVRYRYTAPSSAGPDEAEIRFASSPMPRENVTYTIDVQSAGSSGGAYTVSWRDPSGEPGTSDCSASNCTFSFLSSGTLNLTMGTSPAVPGVSVDYSLNDTGIASLSPGEGATDSSGENSTTLTASSTGNVSVFTTSGGTGDTINITLQAATGDLVYNNDAVAVDGPDSPSPDRAGGVEFSVTNSFGSTVTVDTIQIAPDNPDIVELNDDVTPNDQPTRTEVYAESDVDGYSDLNGGSSLPATIDIGQDGFSNSGVSPEVNSGNAMTFYLYEFYNNQGNGQNADMAGEDVEITLTYTVGGNTFTKTFTITPGGGGGGGGGGINYNNDGTAVDVNSDGTSSGVQFSVTNSEASDVTMTGITVDANGPAAELQESNSGTGPWSNEVFVDASDDGNADAFFSSYSLGDPITLDDDAVISGNGGTATIYLYEFLRNNGQPEDMSGRTIDVTLEFQNHAPVSFSFTA